MGNTFVTASNIVTSIPRLVSTTFVLSSRSVYGRTCINIFCTSPLFCPRIRSPVV